MTSGNGRAKHRFRSRDWFDDPHRRDQSALYLERFMNYGITPDELRSGRPVVGIAQSGSDLSPCNRHHLELAGRVRDGIRDGGGIPMEFPVHPINENCRRPTAALDRNLFYLGLVEILYGYFIDAVVLTTGCDKTTPAAIMAASTVDIPAIVLSGGPMLDGYFEGELVGSGTAIWKSRRRLAAGQIDEEEFFETALASAPSAGQMAYDTGKRIAEMAYEDLRPSKILTRESFLNAIVATTAIGGSTNAQPHIMAMARHAGVEIKPSDWEHGYDVPLLVNMQPAGEYLGERFHRAGGVPAVLSELLQAGKIDGGTRSVTGRSLAESVAGRESKDREMITAHDEPLQERAGFRVLSGNLFDFAIIKTSVISDEFRERYLGDPAKEDVFEGRAVVFDGSDDYHERINDPDLDIDETSILVIRGAGPVGWPGSAEVVNMQPPDSLLKRGINTLPTIGDGRQSGTSDSPSILNAAPESAAGGGLAWLRTGDTIRIDLGTGRCDMLVSDEEIERRKQEEGIPDFPESQTPWQEIYRASVDQLDGGGVIEAALKYRGIATKTPRHNH
jgi:dihydroxyacid dehydratase/phosphogluconate dehydratase